MKSSPAKGFIHLTIANLIFMVTGYGAHVFIARYLGPEEYGIYGIIIGILSILILFLTSGLPRSVSKYVAADPESSHVIIKQGRSLQLLFSFVIWIAYFSSAGLISRALGDPKLVPYLRISSLIIPSYALYSLYIGYFNGLHFFKIQAVLTVIYSFAKLTLVVSLAALFKVFGAVLGFAVSSAVPLLFIPKKSHKSEVNSSPFSYKKLLRFASLIVVFKVTSTLLINLDLLMVKSLLRDNLVTGYYNAAIVVGRLPYYLLVPLGSVLFPSISRSSGMKDMARTRMLIGQSLRFTLMVAAPGVLLIAATSRNLLSLLYSSRYIPAAEPMSILAFGAGFMLLFLMLSSILNGGGREKIPMTLSLIGIPIAFSLNLLLIPRYGLKGAAASATVVSFFLMVSAAFWVYEGFRKLVPPISVLRICAASLIISLPALIIDLKPVFLPVEYALLFTIYFGLLWIFREIRKEDLNIVRGLIPTFTQQV